MGLSHVDVETFWKISRKPTLLLEFSFKKLPLENQLLKSFTSINPLLVASPVKLIHKHLLNLPTLVPDVLNDVEEQVYEDQVRALLLSSSLPPVLVGANDNDAGREVDRVS